jgi:hypothetical protein
MKENGIGGSRNMHGEIWNSYKILVEKSDGKKHLGKVGVDGRMKLKTDLKEIEWDDVECIQVAYDSVEWRVFVNTIINLRIP